MSKIPGRIADISYNGVTLRVKLDMSFGIGGDKWPAADKYCMLISDDQNFAFFNELFCNKSCIELGSGNGIVGILLDKLFNPKKVVITDLESHVSLIKTNIDLNNTGRCVSEALDWKVRSDSSQKYDCIFALECVYRTDLYEPLIRTIIECSHSNTVTFLGLTRDFATPRFFQLLIQYGFHYRKLPDNVFKTKSEPTDSSPDSDNVHGEKCSAAPFVDPSIAVFVLYHNSTM